MQGEPPDSMRQFWRFLLRKALPPDCLAHLSFAVFGLGDSSYPRYNVRSDPLPLKLLAWGQPRSSLAGRSLAGFSH